MVIFIERKWFCHQSPSSHVCSPWSPVVPVVPCGLLWCPVFCAMPLSPVVPFDVLFTFLMLSRGSVCTCLCCCVWCLHLVFSMRLVCVWSLVCSLVRSLLRLIAFQKMGSITTIDLVWKSSKFELSSRCCIHLQILEWCYLLDSMNWRK